MNKRMYMIFLFIGMTLVAIIGLFLAGIVLPQPGHVPPPPPPSEQAIIVVAKVVISMVNLVIIFPLLNMYIKLYRESRSEFTLGLIFIILVFLLYALTSNPLLHIIFGFYASGLGVFAIIPDIFSTFALLTLLYISLD
jgi:hypothetical protein